jgi:hypothetical protein
VVVVVGPLRERAGPCLASLLAQDLRDGSAARGELEILLVDCAEEPLASTPVPHADDRRVRRIRVDPASTFGRARAAGARAARAAGTAFVEEHCRVAPGWAAAVSAALDRGYAGVGYAFLPGNPGVAWSDLNHLTAYSDFLHPTTRREQRRLSGHNAAYRTSALLAFGERLDQLLSCDIVLQELLWRAGEKLLVEPDAVVRHLDETTLQSRIRGLFHYQRASALLRARTLGWSPWRRLGYVLATPLFPFYALRNHLRQLREPRQRAALRRALPAYLAVFTCAGVGQALGLVFGPGDSEAAFTRFENSEPRQES